MNNTNKYRDLIFFQEKNGKNRKMGYIGHSVRYYPPWTFPTFPSISAGIEGCDGKDLLDLKVDSCTLLLSHATLKKYILNAN